VFHGSPELQFVRDFAVHIRFLVCVPLLIIAEPLLEERTRTALKHFLDSGLIQQKDYPTFQSLAGRATRRRDSLLAEAIIIGIVVFGVAFFRLEYAGSLSTWETLVTESGRTRTPA